MTNKDILKLYHKIGLKRRVEDKVVKEVIESQYKFVKEKINELEFNKHLTDEEFNELKTNFLFKYLGRIYTTKYLVDAYIKRKNNGRRSTKNNKRKRAKKTN